jgi:ABC-type antimicrobial peptide transport system permease subunit
MFRSYIKVAWRNIRKNPFHSFINIFGLSIGIVFTLLIGAYVWKELQVNSGLKNANHQYIIQSKWKDPNMGYEIATLAPLAKTLKNEYPSLVANYYRFDGVTSNVSKGDKAFREGLQIGDTTLLDMYGFSLLYGDSQSALKEPFSTIISEDRAMKYFGRTDVVGESLTIENFSGARHDFMITGVMKNPSENSVTSFNSNNENRIYLPLSASDFFGRPMESWANSTIVEYLQLQPGITEKDLQKAMQDVIRRNASPLIAANLSPYAVPLKEYYLKKDNGLVLKMLYTVSFIAFFILIMAIVNFVNISIAKSSGRIREVGVRKSLGGMKKQLMFQFLTESVLLVGFATAFALLAYSFVNPFVANVLGKEIPKLSSFPIWFCVIPVIMAFVIGLLAGLYPALVLSALKAVDSLKGKLKTVKENIVFRKSLVGFQFFTASLVFIGAIIITRQVSFFFSKSLGYDKEYIVSAQLPRDWTKKGVQHMQTIRNEFASMPEVKSVSLSWQMMNGWDVGKLPVFTKGKDSTQAIATQSMVADENYAETYAIPMKAGRFFSNESDSLTIVLNETAAKALGWPDAEEAIGKQVTVPGNSVLTVIGVTKDFHFGSMQEKIQPITFLHVDLYNVYRYFSFKLKPGSVAASLQALQKKWSALLSGTPFDYTFMDDALAKLYQSEIQLKKAAQTATVLALIIVMLGMIGLISLSVQKRTKEIGIRKVLGASPRSIISLFLKEFLPVLLIGGAISVPAAWYVMRGWLNDYAYRIPLTLQPFLFSILILGLITTFVISIQIAKASAENPVKNLRTE